MAAENGEASNATGASHPGGARSSMDMGSGSSGSVIWRHRVTEYCEK